MRNQLISFFVIALFSISYWGCVPPEYGKADYKGVAIDFEDPQVQLIYNMQQRQSVDSLIIMLGNENPTYRYLAATVLGALKEKKAVDSLEFRLKDEFIDVRIASAFALGQIGETRSEVPLLANYERYDTTGKFARFNATIMEAVGKCGTLNRLNDLVNVQTFKLSDTTLLEGQVYGIYRYGLRDSFSAASIKKMTDFVAQNYPPSVRLVAANYLARLKVPAYDTAVTNTVSKILLSEKDANVRIALAKAIGKAENPLVAVGIFESLYRQETDYRVKVAMLSTFKNFDYPRVQPIILACLQERNPHVSAAAAELCISNGRAFDAQYYKRLAGDLTLDNKTRNLMAAAALKWLTFYPRQRDSINTEMQNRYRTTTNIVEKCTLLSGLAELGWNYNFLHDEAMNTANTAVVRTAAAQAVAKVTTAPDFVKQFQASTTRVKIELKAMLFQYIKTGDEGLAYIGAETLRAPEAQFNKALLKDSIPIIYQVMQNLKMPNALETYENLRETINFIADSVSIKKKPYVSTRNIDWNFLKSMNDAQATVRTSKGVLKFRLLHRIAPISVANFVQLAKSGFFDGKTWHRVVPSFVVQTGCSRGDGYGSLDFTIPTELNAYNHYDTEGYVGMASAGLHTECSQWFVTTAPALHLDPKYTIFGKIIEGKEILNQLEVGDIVESVIIN